MEKQANPIPQGKYVPATRWGNLIFTAGMTSRKNGVLILAGQVKGDAPLETYQEAVCQAASNALAAVVNQLAEGEHIAQVLSLMVYVNAEEGFAVHSRLADFATDYLCEQLGAAGVAARAALGVASLPGNAPVEIQMVCAAS
ncbi:MAG: RidA family protein [Lawsonibacter sp.]|nr:RidA family protein [Lawsonibacter sp.]